MLSEVNQRERGGYRIEWSLSTVGYEDKRKGAASTKDNRTQELVHRTELTTGRESEG